MAAGDESAAILIHHADGRQFIYRKRSIFKSTWLATWLLQQERGGRVFFVFFVGFAFFLHWGKQSFDSAMHKNALQDQVLTLLTVAGMIYAAIKVP